MFLSPEGSRIDTGEIGHFNKGAFHLATNLQAPILPIYIAIPKDINPGCGYQVKPGMVHIFLKPAVDTSGWTLQNLLQNKEEVRNQFIRWNLEHAI